MRRALSIIGGSLLFATAAACDDDEYPEDNTPIAGSTCTEEGSESCHSDLNIYRCESGKLVFVRSSTMTSNCPVIGYVGIGTAGQHPDVRPSRPAVIRLRDRGRGLALA